MQGPGEEAWRTTTPIGGASGWTKRNKAGGEFIGGEAANHEKKAAKNSKGCGSRKRQPKAEGVSAIGTRRFGSH
jgi:hypothetical protein